MNKKIFWTLRPLHPDINRLRLQLRDACLCSERQDSSAVELPAQTKLILGTINLEETDYAVTAEQATELLPMFYVLQDLNESDTAAQEEIDGFVNQIQETLTADQVQAIDAMSLSMMSIIRGNGGNADNSGLHYLWRTNGGGAGRST